MTKREQFLYSALKRYTDYWGNLQDIDEDDTSMLEEGLKALGLVDLVENNPYLSRNIEDFSKLDLRKPRPRRR